MTSSIHPVTATVTYHIQIKLWSTWKAVIIRVFSNYLFICYCSSFVSCSVRAITMLPKLSTMLKAHFWSYLCRVNSCHGKLGNCNYFTLFINWFLPFGIFFFFSPPFGYQNRVDSTASLAGFIDYFFRVFVPLSAIPERPVSARLNWRQLCGYASGKKRGLVHFHLVPVHFSLILCIKYRR